MNLDAGCAVPEQGGSKRRGIQRGYGAHQASEPIQKPLSLPKSNLNAFHFHL